MLFILNKMYQLRSMVRKTRSFYATHTTIGLHNGCKLENSLKQFKKEKNKQNKDNNKLNTNTKYEFVCLGFAGYTVVETK